MGQNQSAEGALTLETLAQALASGKFKNVVVMCGAGISTSAGVPDFRSPSAGLYFKIRNIPDLPCPEAVFDGGFFRLNPKPFYSLVRSIFPERLCPTDTHKFFALLNNKGMIFYCKIIYNFLWKDCKDTEMRKKIVFSSCFLIAVYL